MNKTKKKELLSLIRQYKIGKGLIIQSADNIKPGDVGTLDLLSLKKFIMKDPKAYIYAQSNDKQDRLAYWNSIKKFMRGTANHIYVMKVTRNITLVKGFESSPNGNNIVVPTEFILKSDY